MNSQFILESLRNGTASVVNTSTTATEQPQKTIDDKIEVMIAQCKVDLTNEFVALTNEFVAYKRDIDAALCGIQEEIKSLKDNLVQMTTKLDAMDCAPLDDKIRELNTSVATSIKTIQERISRFENRSKGQHN